MFYGSTNTVNRWFQYILWFYNYCKQVVSMCFMVLQILLLDGFNVFYDSASTMNRWFKCVLRFCKYCEQVV